MLWKHNPVFENFKLSKILANDINRSNKFVAIIQMSLSQRNQSVNYLWLATTLFYR